jgi:hypothetical protein
MTTDDTFKMGELKSSVSKSTTRLRLFVLNSVSLVQFSSVQLLLYPETEPL